MRIAANVLKAIFHPGVWLILMSALIITVVVYAGMFFWSVYSRGYETESLVARAESGFRVFYLENDIFDENPIPSTLGFLMSFTDFIQMRSRVDVELTREANVYFSYAATKRMVVRHTEATDANRNPVVYERVIPLHEASGHAHGRRVSFSADGGGSWSYHTVLPKYFVQIYFDFIEAQQAQMAAEGVMALGQHGFAADLYVEFDYTVNVPSFGIVETVSRGYRISLSSEVYDMDVVGTYTIQAEAATGRRVQTFAMPAVRIDLTRYEWLAEQHLLFCIIALIMVFSHGIFCFVSGAKMLARNPHPRKHEAEVILAKYSKMIVTSATPLPLYGYRTMEVEDFATLVRLAKKNNTHILAHHDPEVGAFFAVLVDKNAYEFSIIFDEPDNAKPTAVVADVLVVVDNAEEEEQEDDGLGDAVPEPGPTLSVLGAMG